MNGWISPSIKGFYDETGNVIRAEITTPDEIAGLQVFYVRAQRCMRREDGVDGDIACGLVRNHDGPCWRCSLELLDKVQGAIGIGGVLNAS